MLLKFYFLVKKVVCYHPKITCFAKPLYCLLLLIGIFNHNVFGQITTFPSSWSGVTTSAPATSKDANISGTPTVTRGSGLTAVSSSARFSSSNWSTSASLVLSGNASYLTFTLTPASGYVINLNAATLSFVLSSTGTGPVKYGVYSSVAGFTSTTNQIGADLTTASTSVTFPSSGYNDLPTIEIRIYGWNASSAGGNGGFNSMNLSGSVTSTSTPSLGVTGTTTLGSSCANIASPSVQYTITNLGTVAANVAITSSDAQFVVSGLSATTITASGGTATYNVTFTPTSSGSKSTSINIFYNTNTLATTSMLTGTGTTSVSAIVSSLAATTIAATSATLNGNIGTLGVCPATIEKGFVYAQTSVNNNPQNGGTVVTKTSVAGLSTGAYNLTTTALSSATSYSFNSYVFDGTTYEYGTTRTFTTPSQLANDNCANATVVTTGAAAISGTLLGANATSVTFSENDVWYLFTPTCTGSHTITVTFAAGPDIDFEVYPATSCPTTTVGRVAVAGSSVATSETNTFSYNAGTSYYIRVLDRFSSATTFTIGISTPTPVTQTVTTNSASTISNTLATLNGNVTALGSCPSTTEKGFVYAVTNTNNDPLVNGTGVAKTSVANIIAGAYTLSLTGLTSNTSYSFKAYLYDGTTYTYGAAATFVTLTPATKLAFGTAPPNTSNINTNLATFTVQALRANNSIDIEYTGTVTLTRTIISGTGILSTGTSIVAVAGIATFNTTQFDAAGTYTITAASGALTNIVSSNIVVTNVVPVVIYQHDFGTTGPTSKPYTVDPPIFATNLSSSAWTTSTTTFTGSPGSSGGSLSSTPGTASHTYTLTFNVASGYTLSITSFNFWRISSGTGPTAWAMTVNGTSVGSGLITTTGAAIGQTNVTNTIAGLTGTITVIYTVSGGSSSSGTNRLDDFTLNGNVTCLTPSAPSAANSTTIYDGIAKTITASVGANTTVDWYSAANGGSAILTSSLTSPSNTIVGSYTYYAEARNTVCGLVSTARTAVTVTINQHSLIITPNNVNKTYGTTLTGGSNITAFTAVGLQNSETIGSITIAYGSGSAASATAGTYAGSVVAAAVNGGTFTQSNYTIAYNTSNIIVAYGNTAGVWLGLTNTNFNTTSNWQNNALPTATDDITITAAAPNYPLLITTTTLGNISLANGTTINIGTSSLLVNGTFSGTGVITGSAAASLTIGGTGALGTLYFNQTVSGSSNTLQNLTINGTSNIILGNALNIIGIVTPTTGTITTNGNLTLKSISITNTAIVASGNGTITGDVIVERFIPNNSNGIAQGRRAFRDISPSVITAQSIFNSWQEAGSNSPNYGTQITGEKGASGSFNAVTGIDYTYSGSSSLFSYNINTVSGTATWDAITNTKNAITSPFKGYRILIRGDRTNNLASDIALLTSPTTIRQKGQLISGNVSYTTTNVSANGNTYPIGLAHNANDAFTMIGNPYVCPIDWVSISSRNNTILPTCYIWDPNIATYGAYVTYNSSSGSSNIGSQANRYIQPGQAFFIQNNNTTNPSFTIQESDKVAVQDATHLRDVFGENVEAASSKINITLLKNIGGKMVNMDGAAMCYQTNFSNDIAKEDAEKIDNNSECIAINSHAYLYSIEGKPTPLLTDSISLKLYYTTNNANYELQVNLSQFTSLGLQPYLKDRFTKNSTLLTLGTVNNYAFITTADTNSFNNRFTIIFTANTVLPIHFASIKAYANANVSNTITWLANETTANYYEVEHATNTQNFIAISKVTANGNGLNNYTYHHNYNSIGNNYYRIKGVDKTGLTQYSAIEVVSNTATKTTGINIYPNPIENRIVNIGFNKLIAGKYEVAIYSINGQIVQRSTIVHNGLFSSYTINLSSKLTAGIYSCSISNGSKNIHYQKLLVQ